METFQHPWGSKSRVNRAGNNIRAGTATPQDHMVIEKWRGSYRHVLNTFQAILRNRTRDTTITVAQRHKRRNTIYDKLLRIPDMQLSRMDDIAGCRLIFQSINELNSFRNHFHKASFQHKRRNETDKYDYIAHPKDTGYRGIHDVYEYKVNSIEGKKLKLQGLYIEIQYRTRIQHAWATAVEVIGFITQSQPKFQKGDQRYVKAMALASEILARAHENLKGVFPDMSNEEILMQFSKMDNELSLTQLLINLHLAKQNISLKKNTILIFSESGDLEVRTYRYAPEALNALFNLERKLPDRDIVLVRAESSEELRFAFKNYFSDTAEFIQLLNSGYEILSSKSKTIE